jgi:microcystin-dependent protein
MSQAFIGEIKLFGSNFAPRNWAFCNGQLLAIAQNQAMFSLLGTMFGGNGTTTFALPNLQGRVPLGQGQGPGLTNRTMGEVAGSESVTLLQSQIPPHTHAVNALSSNGTQTSAAGAIWATGQAQYSSNPPNAALNAGAYGVTGNSQPHENMPPVAAVSFIIALAGIFPSRN